MVQELKKDGWEWIQEHGPEDTSVRDSLGEHPVGNRRLIAFD